MSPSRSIASCTSSRVPPRKSSTHECSAFRRYATTLVREELGQPAVDLEMPERLLRVREHQRGARRAPLHEHVEHLQDEGVVHPPPGRSEGGITPADGWRRGRARGRPRAAGPRSGRRTARRTPAASGAAPLRPAAAGARPGRRCAAPFRPGRSESRDSSSRKYSFWSSEKNAIRWKPAACSTSHRHSSISQIRYDVSTKASSVPGP